MTVFPLRTSRRNELIDVTALVRRFIAENGIHDGAVALFVPHTTAAITINENADPDVGTDLLKGLDRISPVLAEFRHGEGNSDAHIKSSLLGASLTLLVENGEPVLGTWQGIYFCEFDGPRARKLIAKAL